MNQNLVWRDEREGQVRVDFVYSELEFDKEISADLFTFQPAEGTVDGKATPAPAAEFSGLGGDVSQPAVIYKVDPEYSEQGRKARLSGTEVLSVVVDTQANARHIRVLKSPGMGLDEKAAQAIQKWKFRPAMKGATPVNVRATIEVNFRLLAPGWIIQRVKFKPPAGTHADSLSSDSGTPWNRTCT